MAITSSLERNGEFIYLAPSTEASLFRNGRVYTRRDNRGSDNEWVGAEFDKRQQSVYNARAFVGADRHTLDPNGFELLDRPLLDLDVDFLNNDSVVQNYYPHCADVIQQANGARLVVAFDHNIRSVPGSQDKRRIEGGQQVQPPLHMVHGDYTITSAPQRLLDLTKPPTSNDTYHAMLTERETLLDETEVLHAIHSGRFAIINLWRNIAAEPVATNPLAVCDAASVDPQDLVVFEIHYADRVGENYYAKHSNRQKWFFYPEMTRDEALLIKQWDSHGELACSKGERADGDRSGGTSTFGFHSAFEDPSVEGDAPERWSIEVRCVALFE